MQQISLFLRSFIAFFVEISTYFEVDTLNIMQNGLMSKDTLFDNCMKVKKTEKFLELAYDKIKKSSFFLNKFIIVSKEDAYEVKKKLEKVDSKNSCCSDDFDVCANIQSSGSRGGRL